MMAGDGDGAAERTRRGGRHRWRRALGVAALAASVALGAACQKSLEDRLAEVRALQELGASDEAIESLRSILAEYPDDPEANLLLGTAQMRAGQPSLAIWPLQIAARSPQRGSEARLILASAYMRLSQNELALEAVDGVLADANASEDYRAGARRLRAALFAEQEDWAAVLDETEILLGELPGDGSALALRAQALIYLEKYEEAEAILLTIWEDASADRTAATQAGIGLVRLYASRFEDPARAEAQIEALVERFSTDEGVLRYAAGYYAGTERREQALTLYRTAVEQEPGNLGLRTAAANQFVGLGDPEAAEALLVEGTELLDTPEAWLTLAEFYRVRGNAPGSLEAIERAMAMIPTPTDALRFKYGGILADNDQLDRAQEQAEAIRDEGYRGLLLGRVAFERGDPAGALEAVDRGLRRWPNNAGGRQLAAHAALALNRPDRAVNELREAVRSDPTSPAGPLLMKIYLTRGDAGAAVSLGALVRTKATAAGKTELAIEALELWVRGQIALRAYEQASNGLEGLEKLGADPATVWVLRGAALADEKGSDAAASELAASGLDWTDPANVPALRALAQYEVESGRTERGLREVDAALAANPELAPLHDLRGRLLVAADRPAEARGAFERARELDPEYAPSLAALAQMQRAAGDSAAAESLLGEAAAAQPENAEYPYLASQIAWARGDLPAAQALLEEAVTRNPYHSGACNDLAWLLTETGGDLDLALRLATRATQLDRSAALLDTLGWVQYKRGNAQAAVESLEEALRLDPSSPSVAYRLSLALVATGDTDRARTLLREALDGGTFPEAEQAREELGRLAAAGS